MTQPIKRPPRRRWRWASGLVLLVLALVIADRNGWLLVPARDDLATYDGVTVRVARVLDGDTLELDLPDSRRQRSLTRVRLWGVDCPDSSRRARPAAPWSDEAQALTRRLVEGKLVTLHLEPDRTRGGLGRVLAHVELPGGSTLNEALLCAGLAAADERWPHTHLTRYDQAERAARRAAVGIWSPSEPLE